MAELLPELLDEGLADLVLQVVVLVLEALLVAGVTANGAHVDHAVAELDKGTALDGDVEVGNVVEDKADELLVLVLADPFDEAVGGQLGAHLVGRQTVLGEAEVEHGRHGPARGAELLLLLDQVGAAYEADGALLAQGLEHGKDLGRGRLENGRRGGGGISTLGQTNSNSSPWAGDRWRQTYQAGGRQGTVNIKQANGVLDGTILKGRVRDGRLGAQRRGIVAGHVDGVEGVGVSLWGEESVSPPKVLGDVLWESWGEVRKDTYMAVNCRPPFFRLDSQ